MYAEAHFKAMQRGGNCGIEIRVFYIRFLHFTTDICCNLLNKNVQQVHSIYSLDACQLFSVEKKKLPSDRGSDLSW